MKNKINQLQDQLSKEIVQEQLLKSENLLLSKELERLRRLRERNSEYTSRAEKQTQLKQRKEKIMMKHEKNMKLMNSKIENCKQTIQKLNSLLGSDHKDLDTNFPMNNKCRNNENVYSCVRCEDCSAVMAPCQYFLHLQGNECPHKA